MFPHLEHSKRDGKKRHRERQGNRIVIFRHLSPASSARNNGITAEQVKGSREVTEDRHVPGSASGAADTVTPRAPPGREQQQPLKDKRQLQWQQQDRIVFHQEMKHWKK